MVGGNGRGCMVFIIVVLAAGWAINLVGLIGLQSVCVDAHDLQVAQLQQRMANLTAQANGTTPLNEVTSTLNSFMSALARSSGFIVCAHVYSLNWWTWVMQLIMLVWVPVAMGRDRMAVQGLPLLLITATLVTLNTYLCSRQVGLQAYSGNSSFWGSVVLAGTIVSTIAYYLLLFAGPPYIRTAVERKKEPMSREVQL